MKKNARTKENGVTLLEMLLVLLIMSSFLILGIQQYQNYQIEQNAIQLRYTINALLEGMSNYYQANCQNGTLAPANLTRFPPVPPIFNDNGNLYSVITQNYINNWQPLNPIVDNDATQSGYLVQFNFFDIPRTKKAYVCYNFWSTTGDAAPGCDTPTLIPGSRVVGWGIQVAVKIRDPQRTAGFVGLTGADCAVTNISDIRAANCANDGVDDDPNNLHYLVWQRVPSYASADISSDLWLTNPVVKEFKLQYTNDPMYEIYLQGVQGSMYYLCGR